jgi:hypothetical protein
LVRDECERNSSDDGSGTNNTNENFHFDLETNHERQSSEVGRTQIRAIPPSLWFPPI